MVLSMIKHKTTMIPLIILAFFAIVPFFAGADVKSEINIDGDGKVTAKNIKVMSISQPGISKFFYGRAIWNDIFIRMTVLTDDSTVIGKNHGEKAGVFDIKEGDILNIEGRFPSSADTLIIQAIKITDLSLEKESKEVRGTITAIATSSAGFIIKTQKGNNIKVNLGSSTPIVKGARKITLAELNVGDTILSVPGTFDYQTYTIDATSVDVYQDKSIFKPKNFSGILKNISGTSLPTIFTVAVEGKDYTVYLSEKTEIMNKAKKAVGLSRFVAGDAIRFYGAIRQTDFSAIDTDTVRNMNF